MIINRAHKFRIYPNESQKVLINKTLGCSRFIFNQMLSERIEVYEKLKNNKRELYDYKYKTEKQLKEEFQFLSEVDSTSLQQARLDLSAAYTNFFNSLKGVRSGQKVGFPKFKSKRNSSSYRTVMRTNVDFEKKIIKILKVGSLPFRQKKMKPWYLTAELKSITISKSASGKYYASCLFIGEQDYKGYQDFETNPKVIGLDMSLSEFYVTSYGESPEYKRIYRETEKKLAKYQRRLSSKTKGSKNREKARIKVAKIHEKIANRRKDFTEKESIKLVRNYDVIVVENLSLKGMSQALSLGKSVMDLGYSSFVNKLMYKSLWNDKTTMKASRWFASSKTCHCCGYIKKDLMLQEREWDCPKCGEHLDRDVNAAINLELKGLEYVLAGSQEVKSMEFKTSGVIELAQLALSLDDEVENLESDFKKSNNL